MFRTSVLLVAIAFLASVTTPAAARWMHTSGEEDPFKGGAMQLAVAINNNGYSLGLRCMNDSDLVVIFMTIEKLDGATSNTAETMPVELRIIIDDSPEVRMPGRAEYTGSDKTLAVIAENESDRVSTLATSIASAKRRVAIAVDLFGNTFHSTVFDVRGSSRAIGALQTRCGLSREEAAEQPED